MIVRRIHDAYGIEVHGTVDVRLRTLDDARRWISPAKGLRCPACGRPTAECFLNCLDVCPTCGSRVTEGGCAGDFVGFALPEPDDQPWSSSTLLIPATDQWPAYI